MRKVPEKTFCQVLGVFCSNTAFEIFLSGLASF